MHEVAVVGLVPQVLAVGGVPAFVVWQDDVLRRHRPGPGCMAEAPTGTGHLDDGIVAIVELGAEGLGHHSVLKVQRGDVGELQDGDVVEMALQLGEELVGDTAVVVDEAVGVGEHGALGGVVGAVGGTLQAGMCVICSSGMPSSRMDLACWL